LRNSAFFEAILVEELFPACLPALVRGGLDWNSGLPARLHGYFA
jgi:hypothetical protein